ncbi:MULTISPECIES: hypothetical protein [Stenotrophomonas]|uniref:hypothetical protein n=1 Tax=Stenotrophomonas TaxID=40323 RepID=UPI00114635DF|nr:MULTISPECIES: hypothetical protein [Stenotrophomonas]MCO5735120.1 hypothetical protein [Stenotrophomonas maltophilia]MCU1055927.1 hypothetical protein [Stenotrophomonas maltophilia]MCZ7844125.1 hypothetical protein [Stenotrophomonas maltophilia]MDH1663519.1 hypothetical protein [Stenotrophomonas sp. GD03777]MDJ1623539.1 hypothetical protein [Stenotrophomonas sepilia]
MSVSTLPSHRARRPRGRGTQYSSWITRFPELTGVVVAVRRKHPASVARLAHRVAAATMR